MGQCVCTSDRQTYCAKPRLSEVFNDDVREWLVHLAKNKRLLKEIAKQQAGIKIKKEGLHLWKNELRYCLGIWTGTIQNIIIKK